MWCFTLLVQLEVVDRFYSISTPLPQPFMESAKNNTADPRARPRKSLFAIFSKNSPPRIHVVGILGIVGPLDALNSGWMVSDFGAWAFLIAQMEAFLPNAPSGTPSVPSAPCSQTVPLYLEKLGVTDSCFLSQSLLKPRSIPRSLPRSSIPSVSFPFRGSHSKRNPARKLFSS